MSTEELKALLHESIENIDDREFLNIVKQLLERKYFPESSHALTDWQVARVEESKEQIAKGDFFTDEMANKLIDQWLKK